MRKFLNWIQILCCICFVFFLGIGNGWATTIDFVHSASSIGIGESIDVEIVISDLGSDDLYDFDFNVNFDVSVLTFDGYTLGTGLGTNVSTDFFDMFADAYDGSSYLGGGVLNLFEQSWIDLSLQDDTFTLATISFTGLAAGSSGLSITSPSQFVADPIFSGELGPIENITINTGNIEVTSGAPVPEPTTMMLFGSGLVLLAGIGRRDGRAK